MYQIVITKFVTNQRYDEEYAEWKEQGRYQPNLSSCPQKEIEQRRLETILTDEEFEAVRKAVIEKM